MFDIVVCSTSKDLMNRSIEIINSSLINYEFDYHICKFNNNCDELSKIINDYKRKIYIIDIDNSLDTAIKIRESNFDSIIILITSHDIIDYSLFNERLLMLDYICNNELFGERLRQDICLALRIIFKENVFVFRYNHVMYRISYKDINYIEKEPKIKRCIIHTLDKDYYVVNSIEKLNSNLSGMFIKTSQSCIINMMNVSYVDCVNNIVYFRNGAMTTLITNKVKKIIKEYI